MAVSDRDVGRMWVFTQVVLLVLLVVLPQREDWPTPFWIELIGVTLAVIGLLVVVLAGRGLGSALTPTPVPNDRGQLATGGPYRFVRHPIYSGVLLAVIGLVLRSGSGLVLLVGLVTVVFFGRKAAWEERRLIDRFAGYPGYAARTPRFVPGIRRRRRPDASEIER